MSNKGKYYSKDGHYYDTLEEAVSAGWAWDEKQGLQKEQNKLIEQQNELIMNQNELAKQKLQNEYDIEKQKLEIEEENNKQKLFSSLNISKKTYDRYIDKNYNDIQEEIDLLYSKQRDYKYYSENVNERIEYVESNTYVYPLYKECLTLPEYKVFKSKSEINIYTALLILDILLVCIIPFLAAIMISDFSLILFIIIVVLIVALIFSAKFVIPRLSYQSEESIDQYIKKHAKFDKDKFIRLLNEEIKQCDDELKPLEQNWQNSYDEFTQFRLNHYNKQIEQLLSDCGYREMIEDFGIDYKSVNSKNKIKDGKIEDYIVYFDEHI